MKKIILAILIAMYSTKISSIAEYNLIDTDIQKIQEVLSIELNLSNQNLNEIEKKELFKKINFKKELINKQLKELKNEKFLPVSIASASAFGIGLTSYKLLKDLYKVLYSGPPSIKEPPIITWGLCALILVISSDRLASSLKNLTDLYDKSKQLTNLNKKLSIAIEGIEIQDKNYKS